MTDAAPVTRRSVGRKLLLAMAALLGFSLAWYVVVRAISPWTAKPLPDPITLKIQFLRS